MTDDIIRKATTADYIETIDNLRAEVERLRAALAHELDLRNRHIESLEARIKELEAEVEAKNKQIKELQDIIDKPPEEADWVADYHLLQSALDGPIIDAARKWHAAYRKAQNSNLMRAKEVERLRSLEKCVSPVIDRQGKTNAALLGQLDVISAYLDTEMAEWKNGDQIAEIAIKFMDRQKQNLNDANSQIATKDARIKELEADRIEARAQYLLFMNDNPGCIAWNFDELDETEQDALREQARYMLELEEPWAYVQLREARELIKGLEAAFLDSLAARLYYEHYPGVSDAYSWHDYPEDACHCMPKEKFREKAREALERIRNGE